MKTDKGISLGFFPLQGLKTKNLYPADVLTPLMCCAINLNETVVIATNNTTKYLATSHLYFFFKYYNMNERIVQILLNMQLIDWKMKSYFLIL
jgi:hypothetical protein